MIGPDEGTWNHIGLGLQEKTSTSINAKLCKEGISQKIAACTIPERTNTIWSQETIRNTKIISIASGCQNQEVHPTSMRQVSIPGPSSRQHTTLSHKRHSVTIISTYDTLENTMKLLDYLGTQEDAVLSYHASNMIVAVHSDASYLSEPGARSRAGGHFFLSSDTPIPPNNGAAVLNIAIKNVMLSATEAELAGLYIMAREAVYIRIILEEIGHKQPPTPLQTDNAMAEAVINGKVQPKRTKAMDMRFHWLRDRERQQQFRIYWRPGKMSYADYWTKHHPEAHHRNIRNEFLTPHIVLEMLRIEQQQEKYASNAV